MKLEKREITLNECDSVRDLLFLEKALLCEYVEMLTKVKRKETRSRVLELLTETAQETFWTSDLLDKLLEQSIKKM